MVSSTIEFGGASAVTEVASSSTKEVLQHFHRVLDAHFIDLRDRRTSSTERYSPVFALEHDLAPGDLDLLKQAVRAAVQAGLGRRYHASWLPFIVYAAESGYDYVGDEYWSTFERATPGWRTDHRQLIKKWFREFAEDYDGAQPTGAFAQSFKIIAWPITHAVLPTYLQRQLAQLLYDFSSALTAELLEDPEALGVRLARRASNYTERFRIFCDNTTLVGQVAVALLSGESEPTPYLSASTLARIVAGLSEEQQSHHWLNSARQSAKTVRGFRPSDPRPSNASGSSSAPRTTDPRLFLRFDGAWQAYAELPDLTAVGADFPEMYNHLRLSRASVSGVARSVPPSGLLYPGQEVRFAKWPRPDQPFLQLDRGDKQTNRILANQCALTPGPWWLFRRHGTGLALEVKSKVVRPGHHYVLIGANTLIAPAVPWCDRVAISVHDAQAYNLSIPARLSEDEEMLLQDTGLTVRSHVAIRPVGLVASAWDGEGEAEWLAGEPATLGIRSDLLPSRCRLTIDGTIHFLPWPDTEAELLFCLDDLPVGTHELSAALLGDDDRQIAGGSLTITIRDPQVRPEGASIGEGIRLLANPARPTLSELWDERAEITIDGPPNTEVNLRMILHDVKNTPLLDLRRTVKLPLTHQNWRAAVKAMRTDSGFSNAYDTAQSSSLTIARDGIGFATLDCERGFQPLRWLFTHDHDSNFIATLIDRTDDGRTTIDFYDVEAPLEAISKDPTQPFHVPTRGGLALARSGDVATAAILPTNPTELWRSPQKRLVISTPAASPREVLLLAKAHQHWSEADLPADPFAVHQQHLVCEAISRAISTSISGRHWGAMEHKLLNANEAINHLDAMQAAVGIARDHKALAATIARNLYQWLKAEDLVAGFHDLISPQLAGYGITGQPAASRFLLMLAGWPNRVHEWKVEDATLILNGVISSPVLYRAARFAVLGTRALNDDEVAGRGSL